MKKRSVSLSHTRMLGSSYLLQQTKQNKLKTKTNDAPRTTHQAMAQSPVTVAGDGSQTRSVCFVDDTVRGILDLAESGHPGPMNIGSPDEISMLDLARCVIRRTGSSSTVEFVPLPVDDPRVRRPDTSLAKAVLGWQAEVPLETGLDRTIAWHRAALTAA